MLDMGRAMGCRVIAEGVETERECRELVDLGIDRLQGNLFGRPDVAPMAALQQLESLDRSIVTHTALCAEHIAIYVRPGRTRHARAGARRPVPRPSRSPDAAGRAGRPAARRGPPRAAVRPARQAAASGDLQQEAGDRDHGVADAADRRPAAPRAGQPAGDAEGPPAADRGVRDHQGRPLPRPRPDHRRAAADHRAAAAVGQAFQSAHAAAGQRGAAQLHRSPDRESQALRRRVFRPGFVQALQRRVRLRAGRPGDPAPGGPAEEHVLGAARFRRRTSAATTSSS